MKKLFALLLSIISFSVVSTPLWASCWVYTNSFDQANIESFAYLVKSYNGFATEYHDCDSYGSDVGVYSQAIKFVTEEMGYDSSYTVNNNTIVLEELNSGTDTISIGNSHDTLTLVIGNSGLSDGVIILDARTESLNPVFDCKADAHTITFRNMLILTNGIDKTTFLEESCLASGSYLAVCPGDYIKNANGSYACDTDQDGYGDINDGGSDCNDQDASIHPGATEIPGDGIDQDCDGSDGGCSLDVSPTDSSIEAGDSESYTVTYNGTGGYEGSATLVVSGLDSTMSAGSIVGLDSGASATIVVSTLTSTPAASYALTFSAVTSESTSSSMFTRSHSSGSIHISDGSLGTSSVPDLSSDSSSSGLCLATAKLTVTAAEEECTDPTTWYQDADGDGYGTQIADSGSLIEACDQPAGYVSNNDDCDDTDATLTTDCSACDDPTIWYQDLDGDGYGDESVSTSSCDQPTGYISTGGDCDDTDQSINPEGTEVCGDNADNDCDGQVDEGSIWYRDADGDGYGDINVTKESCTQPTGYVDNSGDCDDTDATINPDATDIPDDDIDQNCDSLFASENPSTGGMILSGEGANRGCGFRLNSPAISRETSFGLVACFLFLFMVPLLLLRRKAF